ncbi:hypothetical protein QT711_02270 [Sporosarcina saromensis]|uniref:Uncharacterized protein n=1 Tax=Sporosarcina saromensis TaxID=359365 RepID=A0ABU4G4T3_9BACL|nr:hypothetical protein [Sporosarcina saromensis]MDW0111994.1 hypothetical protein [Sporosarcina saromensis]
MGLFINKTHHQNLLAGSRPSDESNQQSYRSDSLSELLKEQKNVLEAMKNQQQAIEKKVGKQHRLQTDRWTTTRMRIDEVLDNQEQQFQFEQDALQAIEQLQRQNINLQDVLQQKSSVHDELVHQIETLTYSNEQLMSRLNKLDEDQEVMLSKMDEQIEKQNQFATSLQEQQTVHSRIVERLDNQEGLIDKILRQLDYFRSILYERTHFISEKIDNSISFLSSRKTESK